VNQRTTNKREVTFAHDVIDKQNTPEAKVKLQQVDVRYLRACRVTVRLISRSV